MLNKLKSRKKSNSKKMNVYSNLASARNANKRAKHSQRQKLREKAPKSLGKKLLFYMHPINFAKFWFSRNGFIFALKITGVFILLSMLLVGGLFAYYRKDLDAISPGELAKKVSTTVNTYYDRNGQVIYQDKGTENYKIVVDSADISNYVKEATVAIEDQNFYHHPGISITGTLRALINNLTGGSTQGGSTLTQQLVKQVFLSDQTANRGIGGIPRKIKELILSLEIERMYNKDQILTLYLNESPYGGPRNGVESAAQTYFGKTAKDLTIAEAAILASIPQDPSLYNPYNTAGNEYLIARQHKVIDNMVDLKMITKAQGDAAKAEPILDTIKPLSSQYAGVLAPHFIQMVKSELQNTLGAAVLGRGGLKITTTLDLRIQQKLVDAMNAMFSSNTPIAAGFSNGAATVEDVKTGQIVALMGSRDFNYPGFGQDNAAIAYIQPGSSIKPLVYADLFQKKPAGQLNFGSGSILSDVNIDSLYGAPVFDADRKFLGDITIRQALATSRNIPAIKAMYINGVSDSISTIHAMGGTSYCSVGNDVQVGLSAAIGGCGIKQVDLVNAYATLARQGVYMPQSDVLQVQDSNGQTLYQWQASSKRVVDAQATYIVSDILTDDAARAPLDGRYAIGMAIPGVQTATKTGTSDKNGQSKDIWMASYSPVLAMAVWFGNNDTSLLRIGTSKMPGPIIAAVMEYAHKEVYAKDGRWKSGDWFSQPAGIQRVGGEVYPSWWTKDQGVTQTTLVMDKFSKKKATQCTPDNAKTTITVKQSIDPITGKNVYIAPDGYDANSDDDKHQCTDKQPAIALTATRTDNTIQMTATVTPGTWNVNEVDFKVNGTLVDAITSGTTYSYTYTIPTGATYPIEVSAVVTDEAYYTSSDIKDVN